MPSISFFIAKCLGANQHLALVIRSAASWSALVPPWPPLLSSLAVAVLGYLILERSYKR